MNKKQATALPPAPKAENAQAVELATESLQAATPADNKWAEFIQLMNNATDEDKDQLREVLDLNKTHTRVRKNTANNQQVRNTVKAFGEVTHTPEFMPDPPSRIAERGPEAIVIWKNRWLEGNGNNLSEFDLDQISTAHQ